MLSALHLRDFVIVRELDLDFSQGLTVLTGETGAGKSILIDALGLLLGDRADAGVVRHGAERAELSAEFNCDKIPAVAAWLAEQGLSDEGEPLIIRRIIDASGKSRSFINGSPVTLAQLKGVGEFLVDIHGQHAHQSLLRHDAQRDLLDAYAGTTQQARDLAKKYHVWQTLAQQLNDAEQNAERFEAERERLQWQIDEVAALNMQAGEWPELQADHKRLHHAAGLIDGVQDGLLALSDGDDNCQSWLATVAHRLSQLADFDPSINETLELIAGAEAQLAESVSALRLYADRLELDPERLAEVEARLDAMYKMGRKYRVDPSQLLEQLHEWQARLAELGGAEGLDALRKQVTSAEAAYRKLATTVSKQRAVAAKKLSSLVTEQMQLLALSGSRCEVVLQELAHPAAYGLEQIELQTANHPASPLRPMAKVASGGELSRISLALQVVTSQVANVPTLIFDEVDVGIGGRVAEIVGRLLSELGQNRQVLCITHLPQVAACGAQHLQVAKQQGKDGVVSSIEMLSHEARIGEIARMLGGLDITETTRQHAAEMLA
ncbi:MULTISPECIES: DNA repair protein RecN [Deefgea]|uniref:DNA repair protein RecN n=1 Tax=Deefgea chitinilytica TaxID=570276 RepID=A0ABS2C9E6_9NEIS|nr:MULTISPECIES: DNA repair protein RecN [Deefgea]MBM5570652.1 DNA repair protein RecN [Deefgea chitinilytica]MBM9887881.1 DNA repair protein RecN [Deefgea sp. CFH1-16]